MVNTLQTLSGDQIASFRTDAEAKFGVRPCLWQCEVALRLLARENLVSISETGSGKTLTFWLPMMREKGLTIIITPLKTLGRQIAEQSLQYGFRGVSITAELLGTNPKVVTVRHTVCVEI